MLDQEDDEFNNSTGLINLSEENGEAGEKMIIYYLRLLEKSIEMYFVFAMNSRFSRL